MTKYLLKFLQNAILADQICFLKNWYFLNPDFGSNQPSWFFDIIKDQLESDFEMQLYLMFTSKMNSDERHKLFGQDD